MGFTLLFSSLKTRHIQNTNENKCIEVHADKRGLFVLTCLYRESSSAMMGDAKKIHAFLLGKSEKAPKHTSLMDNEKHTTFGEFHLGKLIKAELAKQGRSITWLANQIDCTRENLYKLFKSPWINTYTLFKISEALDYDFFKVCSDYFKVQRNEKK